MQKKKLNIYVPFSYFKNSKKYIYLNFDLENRLLNKNFPIKECFDTTFFNS